MLINGEATAGIVWGAEAHLAKRENPAIEAVLPKEGTNIWMHKFSSLSLAEQTGTEMLSTLF